MAKAYKVDFEIKTLPRFLAAAAAGLKTFTVRKNDRPYEIGKIVRAYMPGFPQIFCDFKITYVLKAEEFPQGLQPGYCVCGLELMDKKQRDTVIAAYSVIHKIEETLNFNRENLEYLHKPPTCRSDHVWASIWYQHAAQIHDLLNNNIRGTVNCGAGGENDE